MTPEQTESEHLPTNAGPEASAIKSWYVVFVLMFCFTLSYVDRQILSLLIAPIKHDLHLSDTQVGLLQGLAFGIFFALLGVPLGRLVDRHNRRNIIAGGALVWSIMTALCGLARSFGALFLPRIGVGAGEATLTPAVFSLMSDYFPPTQLPFAMSIYSLGIFLGSGAAFTIGGYSVDRLLRHAPVTLPWLGQLEPWRMAFILLSVPGAIGIALLATVREPLRRKAIRDASGKFLPVSIPEAIRQVRLRWKATLALVIGLNCQSMCSYAFLGWAPAYFQRHFGWTVRHAGHDLGILLLCFGCVGMISGGRLAIYRQKRNHSAASLEIGVVAAIGMALFFIPAMLSTNPVIAIRWLAGFVFFLGLPIGSLFAAIQMIYPSNVRGQVSSYFSFLNLISLILGPLVPALINDRVFHNEAKLGLSMAVSVTFACGLMLLSLALGIRPYRSAYRDLQDGSNLGVAL